MRHSRNSQQQSQPGNEIEYGISASPLGRMLVAGTARGISSVYLGDSDKQLEQELQRNYPQARVRHNPQAVGQWTKQVLGVLEGRKPAAAMPLDIEATKATVLQRKVWKELQKIPSGSLCSYSDISRRIGKPKAVRAVANAIGKNPIAILIPCHRVVRKGGELGGYRGGIERKRALLAREQASGQARF